MARNITSIIYNKIYPIVAKALEKNDAKFRANINLFFNKNHELLYDIAPYDRIYYNQNDVDALYRSLGLNPNEILLHMRSIFYWDEPYKPQCAKEPYVITLFCAIRYYLLHNQMKNAELTTIYLSFTGKFYSSLHGLLFPKFPPNKYKQVMDFVINNMLTMKFDLKKEGTIFGAVKALSITWLNTYANMIKSHRDDDEVGKLLQQLRDREKSFLKNIASLYYEAFENRNYLNYETDNLEDDKFRLVDNDAATAARITENTMSYLTSNYVSLDICNKCKDSNVKALEIKDIIESILGNKDNLHDVRTCVNILIVDFLRNYPGKRIGSTDFVAYSIKAKPNTKDKNLIELKTIIGSWLDENSPNYRRRKSRLATANSYYRSILLYFVLTINKVANK